MGPWEAEFWRGLWTWPPWVICAPAFNHKLRKFSTFRGFSEIVFLKKPHKRTEELRIGQWKGYYMEHCGSKLPNRRINSKWNCKRPNNSLMRPTIVLPLFFPCRNFCAENFVIFFYEIKLLFTYFTYLQVNTKRFIELGKESKPSWDAQITYK